MRRMLSTQSRDFQHLFIAASTVAGCGAAAASILPYLVAVAVAEQRSFTRAARRLHLTQQSLSAAIAGLERQLGCALLDRTTQRVELTVASCCGS